MQAIASLGKGDKDAFKKHITEAFWLSPGQAAQLAEMLQYMNLRVRGLIESVKSKPTTDRVTLEQRKWQNLIDLQLRLAGYLRRIGEPGE